MNENNLDEAREFSLIIENISIKENIKCLDALIEYMNNNLLDPDEIKDLLTPSLKEKLYSDFKDLNYVKKDSETYKLF